MEYFNPYTEQHTLLLKCLEEAFLNDIGIYQFGNRTQHIFKNKKYLMTVNWSLV